MSERSLEERIRLRLLMEPSRRRPCDDRSADELEAAHAAHVAWVEIQDSVADPRPMRRSSD